MPDILNDVPSTFETGLPDLNPGDSVDFEIHNEARQALRTLNQFAFAERGAPGLTLTADQSTHGGQIRVDEAWAVVGATAAPPRAHAHRVEMLPAPVTVVSRADLTADAELGPTSLIGLPGLGGAPRGVIGAILSLRGTAALNVDPPDPNGISATLSRAVRPFLREPSTNQTWTLDIVFDRLEHDRQVMLRGTSFVDGIHVFDGSMAASYDVDVVGWVLPS